jgi:hypothetical protein
MTLITQITQTMRRQRRLVIGCGRICKGPMWSW